MFLLNGRPLSPDSPFTTLDGIQYPANWLRLSTLEEKEAIGITEVPDPPSYDQRFYWGYDTDGKLIPKDHDQLVDQWIQQTRTTAGTLLLPSDWMIVREIDNGTTINTEWKTWRQAIRTTSEEKIIHIFTTTDTPELAAYITSTDYSTWPRDPNSPVEPVPLEETTTPIDSEIL